MIIKYAVNKYKIKLYIIILFNIFIDPYFLYSCIKKGKVNNNAIKGKVIKAISIGNL